MARWTLASVFLVALRSLLIFMYFWMVCWFGVLLSIFRWKNTQNNCTLARALGKVVLPIGSLRLKAEGLHHLEEHKPAIYVANHQSNCDVAVYGSICPTNTVSIAKASLRWVPVFGYLLEAGGNIMINRANRDKAISSLDAAVERIKQDGVSVWVFPEGTRNKKNANKLLPFKKGAFHMAVQAQCPIVPIVASPYKHLIDFRKGEWRGGVIHAKVLPPIPTKGMTAADVDSLLERVQQQMGDTLEELIVAAEQDNVSSNKLSNH
ncbi:1-acylglycerol-3-phosphate O-acyltransferase [Balamuthia mandrillaris]